MTSPGSTGPTDGLGDPTARRRRSRRLMWAIAALEIVTLSVLLTNLTLLGDDRATAAVIGPLHGAAYLAGVLLTWSGHYPTRLKLLAVVPVLGALAAASRTPGRTPAPARDGASPP